MRRRVDRSGKQRIYQALASSSEGHCCCFIFLQILALLALVKENESESGNCHNYRTDPFTKLQFPEQGAVHPVTVDDA
jgi:hypothetical protein